MEGLIWSRATKTDRDDLRRFQCSDDPQKFDSGRSKPHEKPWEREVQSYIRRSHSENSLDRTVLIGRRTDGDISAVVHVRNTPLASEIFHISVLAVDVGHRGLGLGDEALDEALRYAAESGGEQGFSEVIVTANIHVRNVYSERLFSRNGFERQANPNHGLYRQWAVVVDFVTVPNEDEMVGG